MDFKPTVPFNIANLDMLQWAYTGESFVDSSFPSDADMHIPLHQTNTFNPFHADECSTALSSTSPYDDASIGTAIQEYPINPPVMEPDFEDMEFDCLLWDNFIHGNEPILTDTSRQETLQDVANQGFRVSAGDACGKLLEAQCDVKAIEAPSNKKMSSAKSKLRKLGFDEISKYFYMTITDAAKELNVGLTVLKKRCRELGISRWPHRKMKSLKSLIHNVQELGKGTAVDDIQREINMLQEHKLLMEKMPELELSDRTKRLRQACFKANYKKRRAMQLS